MPQIAANTPITVLAECPTGETYHDPGNPAVCSDSCSNSTGAALDRCADGNLVSGDGCSATCYIEPDYTCTRFPNALDICYSCDASYTSNSDNTGCVETESDNLTYYIIETTKFMVIISLITTLFAYLFNIASPQSIFAMLNQLQLVLLIPLLQVYLPYEIVKFLRGVSFALGTFGSFDFFSMSAIDQYEHPMVEFRIIGIDSSLTFNNFQTIGMICVISGLLHYCLWPVYNEVKKNPEHR